MNNHENLLFARSNYRGALTPNKLVFNANLQEFSQRVNYICSLETGGRLDTSEAFEQLKSLWQQLDLTYYQQLGKD
jgi:hypothetical protein